jgi:hypothetical protein
MKYINNDLVDNYEGMSEEEEWDHNKIVAPESNLACQVHAILNDKCFSMPSGGSESSVVKGRDSPLMHSRVHTKTRRSQQNTFSLLSVNM